MLYFLRLALFREKGEHPLSLFLGIASVALAQTAIGAQAQDLALPFLNKQVSLGIWYRALAPVALDIT